MKRPLQTRDIISLPERLIFIAEGLAEERLKVQKGSYAYAVLCHDELLIRLALIDPFIIFFLADLVSWQTIFPNTQGKDNRTTATGASTFQRRAALSEKWTTALRDLDHLIGDYVVNCLSLLSSDPDTLFLDNDDNRLRPAGLVRLLGSYIRKGTGAKVSNATLHRYLFPVRAESIGELNLTLHLTYATRAWLARYYGR